MTIHSKALRNLAVGLSVLFGFTCQSLFARAAQSPCSTRTFEGRPFTVCAVDLATAEIKLFLRRPDGTLYLQPDKLPRENLLFSMNAGMFGINHLPIGLYVEGGIQSVALNTKSGGGNFHLQPNGVFWIQDGKAAISTTSVYATARPTPGLATQSGPMLVIDGAINPKFDADGPSRYVRNGVGVSDATHVYFAISGQPVSFGVFARLFLHELKCANALYLDGAVSQLYLGSSADGYGIADLGPLIGVYRKD